MYQDTINLEWSGILQLSDHLLHHVLVNLAVL